MCTSVVWLLMFQEKLMYVLTILACMSKGHFITLVQVKLCSKDVCCDLRLKLVTKLNHDIRSQLKKKIKIQTHFHKCVKMQKK